MKEEVFRFIFALVMCLIVFVAFYAGVYFGSTVERAKYESGKQIINELGESHE